MIVDNKLSQIVQEIHEIISEARKRTAQVMNSELLNSYWHIGRIICEYEQSIPERADYGKQTLKMLSKELTKESVKGFSRANLYNMRLFYQTYEKMPDSVWQIELVRSRIERPLFERSLLSRGEVNKEQLIRQAETVLEKWYEKEKNSQ